MERALAIPASASPPYVKGRRMTLGQAKRAKHAFLKAFAHWGIVTHACALAGIGSTATVYNWLESDEAFALKYREAEAASLGVLEKEAFRRATEGSPYKRTSYWKGQPVGTDEKTEYSDALMVTLLRARAPEKYRENLTLNVTQVVKAVAGVNPEEVV